MYGPDIPRFTKSEEEALAKQHWNDNITPTLRFSDLYEKKISSVYTALPEYVYKKWYFQRIMTIGDAAHKVCLKIKSSEFWSSTGISDNIFILV